MTIYAVMIGAGITTICIQIAKWLAERKPEDVWYREIELMDFEDSEPTNGIERSYPKLSLLDHSDYQLIAGCVEYSICVDDKGKFYRKAFRRPVRIILKRDFHLTNDTYIVSMPLDNLVVKAHRTGNARELIGYENI